jgi:hypothetical protein
MAAASSLDDDDAAGRLAALLDRADALGGAALDLGVLAGAPLRGELPAAVVARLGARLERLNCAGHAFSALPPAFCGAALPRLRTLFFLGNAFARAPPQLAGLPALFMLSLKSQRPPLEEVPEDCLAPSLGWLILTDNAIPRLPAALGALGNLRKLMLAGNRLEALPAAVGGLASLELARLSDNRLAEVPLALLRLPRLAWLALAGNPCCPPPLGGGSFAFAVQGGGADSAPAAWADAPAACGF